MTTKKKNQEKYEKLEIGVKDFGPISSGSVAIKPFTILIGPNNSGKSYFSMLLHSILESFYLITLGIKKDEIIENFAKVKSQVKGLKEGDEFELPKTFLERISQIVLDDLVEKDLKSQLIRSYACQIRELTRNSKQTFSLRIGVNSSGIHLDFNKFGLKIKKYPEFDVKISVRMIASDINVVSDPSNFRIIKKEKMYSLLITKENLNRKDIDNTLMMHFFNFMIDYWYFKFKDILLPCYYLPAARSGILQGHKALVSNIVKKVPYAGIEKVEIPRFSGVVSDFLSSLVELSDQRGPFFELSREFERELIKGEVVVKTVDNYMYPEIKYHFKGKEIALHRSSSTVHELAPLFLYLKYKVEPGNILIIEEPEAHLHPENQRKLAKLLVRLIRKGVKLFITTHSDYLLDQLSSFIMLSQMKNQKQGRNLNYDKDDYLKPEEIGVYVFSLDKKADGYKIEEVEVSREEGISQEEFLKVSEALYEESLVIQQDIQSENNSDATS